MDVLTVFFSKKISKGITKLPTIFSLSQPPETLNLPVSPRGLLLIRIIHLRWDRSRPRRESSVGEVLGKETAEFTTEETETHRTLWEGPINTGYS